MARDIRVFEAYYSLMDRQIGIKPTLSYKRKKKVNIYKSHKSSSRLERGWRRRGHNARLLLVL